MQASNVDLVIFDCDGVLIDSEILSAQTLIDLLQELGIHIDLAHVQRCFLGRSFPTVAGLIREQFSVDLPQGFERDYRRILLKKFETELQPTPGIEAVLNNLGVRACVATSSSPERALRSLELAGLAGYFEGRVYTASMVARGKPAPDLFLHVASCEKVAPGRCLIIEDSLPGLSAAQAADMAVWRYVGASHLKNNAQALIAESGQTVLFECWSAFFPMMPSLRRVQDKVELNGQNR